MMSGCSEIALGLIIILAIVNDVEIFNINTSLLAIHYHTCWHNNLFHGNYSTLSGSNLTQSSYS